MKHIATPGRALGALGLALFASTAIAQGGADAAAAARRSPPATAAGQPVRHADGTPRTYTRAELAAAAAAARVTAPPQAARPASAPGSGVEASWSFSAWGSNIGGSGLVMAANGKHNEVYAGGSTSTFGGDDYWYALKYAHDGSASQVFVSEHLPQSIVRIALAREGAGVVPRIVVALANGTMMEYDQHSKQLLSSAAGPCSAHGSLQAFITADMDGDGVDEYLSVCGDATLVVSGPKYTTWSLAGIGGTDIVAANLDGDPAIEIATTDGHVVDGNKHKVQWTWSQGFGAHLRTANLGTGAAYDGLIVASSWYLVTAFDVGRQLPVWTLNTPQDIGAIAIGDVDGDGTPELLIGDGQWGAVKAYDIATQALKGSIANPEHGVTNILVGDVTGDGKPDLLWGAGATSTGSDFLYTADWATKKITWQNLDLGGPFLGPLVGDLDGDGIPEIVFASAWSDSSYDSGRIVVVDSRTMKVRGVSPFLCNNFAWQGIHDLKLRDLGNGRMSVLVAADDLYDGMLEAWQFNADNSFKRTFTNATLPSNTAFYAVDAADLDGDGQVEIIGGTTNTVYAYDSATGAQKWQSLQMQGNPIDALVIADLDGDGTLDIAAQGRGSNIYLLAAPTHAVEAIIQGSPTQTMSLTTWNGAPALLLAGADGHVGIWQHAGKGFVERTGQTFWPSPITGATVAANGDWWIGQDGVVTRYRKGEALFYTANYGTGFGRDIAFVDGKKSMMLSGGAFGVQGFKTKP